jgi:hypothetical protein
MNADGHRWKKGSWLVSIGMLAVAASAQSPIESLWLTSVQPFPGGSERDRVLAKALKKWRQAKVFDAVMLLKLPATFADEKEFTAQANALIKDVGGEFVIVTLPVGTEGWESSANQRLAQKKTGGHYDGGKAMPQLQWLATLKDLDAGTWAWVLEQPAHMPTPEQAARSASEFVRYARAQHKKTAIWLSAQALTNPRFKEMTQRICEATRADADYFGWMDLPGESLRSGESRWQETLDGLLDQILAMTPKEKTVIQWSHNPSWPANDVAGTKAYISACQAKGINRFCLLSSPQFLEREPWSEFYRTLKKVSR